MSEMEKQKTFYKRRKYNLKELRELTIKLKNKKISGIKLFSAIDDIGEEQYKEAKDAIALYLNDAEPDIRRISILVLGLWGLKEYYPQAKDMFLYDPDDVVKMHAASAIGKMFESTQNKEVIRVLLPSLFEDKHDRGFKSIVYDAILHILGIPTRQHPLVYSENYLQKKVDWNFVKQLQEGVLKKQRYKIDADFKIVPA